MKKKEAFAVLTRLGEKGFLGKSTLKEITKDIACFLAEEEENEQVRIQ